MSELEIMENLFQDYLDVWDRAKELMVAHGGRKKDPIDWLSDEVEKSGSELFPPAPKQLPRLLDPVAQEKHIDAGIAEQTTGICPISFIDEYEE